MKSKLLTEEQSKQLIEDYYNDIPLQEIADKYQVKKDYIPHYIRKNNLPRRLSHCEKVADDVIKEYTSGVLMKDVMVKYNVSSAFVLKELKRRNITYKNDHGRRCFFNKQYFKNIDTEEKAYWLGYLYADGSICKTDKSCLTYNRLSLNLSYKDRIIIETFLKSINAQNVKIQDYEPKGTYSTNMMSRAHLNSKELVVDLINHGFEIRKELRTSVPSIDKSLYRHFVRGLLDGDGSISQINFQITGYRDFLLSVAKIINNTLNIEHTIYDYSDRDIDERIIDIRYKTKYVPKIVNWLYKDATIFLERKYNKIKNLLVSQ